MLTRRNRHRGCIHSMSVLLPRPLPPTMATGCASPASRSKSRVSSSRSRPSRIPQKPLRASFSGCMLMLWVNPNRFARARSRPKEARRPPDRRSTGRPFVLATQGHARAKVTTTHCQQAIGRHHARDRPHLGRPRQGKARQAQRLAKELVPNNAHFSLMQPIFLSVSH